MQKLKASPYPSRNVLDVQPSLHLDSVEVEIKSQSLKLFYFSTLTVH